MEATKNTGSSLWLTENAAQFELISESAAQVDSQYQHAQAHKQRNKARIRKLTRDSVSQSHKEIKQKDEPIKKQ